MADEVRLTVRIPRDLANGVEKVQAARGLTPSIILREALTLYLEAFAGSTETERRRQFSSEYLFLGIDLLIQRQFPDAHEALMAEADRRVEALYASS